MGGREEAVVDADEGGQDQARVAECPKDGEALLKSDLEQAVSGGKDALGRTPPSLPPGQAGSSTQGHDKNEADLAEGPGEGRRVDQVAFGWRGELTVERRGVAEEGAIGGKHGGMLQNKCSGVKPRVVQTSHKRSDFGLGIVLALHGARMGDGGSKPPRPKDLRLSLGMAPASLRRVRQGLRLDGGLPGKNHWHRWGRLRRGRGAAAGPGRRRWRILSAREGQHC
jgi:hypothetical protein